LDHFNIPYHAENLMIKKAKTKRSEENLIIYTDPDFPLRGDNIFASCGFYKTWQQFEKFNEGMKVLIVVPKINLPKSKRKKIK
jgi:hypothetical protein